MASAGENSWSLDRQIPMPVAEDVIAMNHELSRASLEARLTTRVIGRHLELHGEIDSTNTRAVTLAREGTPDGTLVLAERQTRGRGRLGRRWFAPKGTSLLLSLVLRPKLLPRQALRAMMICSLATVEAIRRTSGLSVQVKWPNDIVAHGAKLGGFLTELGLRGRQLDYVVVGMGLNVNLDISALPAWPTPPTSLSAVVGHPVSRLELLVAILEEIETRYYKMCAGWSPHQEWREHLATLGQLVCVTGSQGSIEGVAEDVDQDGALLVRTGDGELRRVLADDVTLRGHPPLRRTPPTPG